MTDQQRELLDAREQLAASREILAALGRNAFDPSAVLETVLEYAQRLCGAAAAQLFVRDGDVFRLSRVSGDTPEDYRDYLTDHPIARNRLSTVGRAAEDKCTHQIPDVLADADYGRMDLQRLTGFRTLLSTPMILQDEVVGVLTMWRTDVAPFDERERQLLEEFAVQGAIVLRQVDLVRDLESRGYELSDKVEQLEALREVDEAVGSSLDLDEVLERIVTNAVRLTNLGFGDITLSTDGGSILEYDVATDSFHIRGPYGSNPNLLERLQAITIDRRSTLIGQSVMADQPLEIPDLTAIERDEFLETVFEDGWRSMLAVPMIGGDTIIGVLVIRRRGTGDFPPDVIELLETFASQSAVAIINASLYRELQTQSRELEIASNHKSEFLASMSHELRTPLNAVIGFSEVLLERLFGDINDRQEEYLRDILNSGRHLLELLNEILDLSKVEAGHMVLLPSTFSAAGALQWSLSMVRERAAAHAITVSVDIADDVGLIEADEKRFKQVVLNLLSNAVKFTPDGGRVSIRAYVDDDELAFAVTDTGIGIPVEDRERIFESFQQGGRGPAREEGTGLGLTLCRRIVGLMGGRMWLESTVGEGSTFGFTVPATSHPAPEMSAPRHGDLPVVVLVDDDRASLDLMSAYLDDAPVQVIRATDGVSALELIRKVLPAAVVLDIKLPRLDGWQVLSELKTAEATVAIPVVIASIVDDRQRGTDLGADLQLLKPVSRDDLIGALRKVGAFTEGGE